MKEARQSEITVIQEKSVFRASVLEINAKFSLFCCLFGYGLLWSAYLLRLLALLAAFISDLRITELKKKLICTSTLMNHLQKRNKDTFRNKVKLIRRVG